MLYVSRGFLLPNIQNHNPVSYESTFLPLLSLKSGAVDADTSMTKPQMDHFGIEYSLLCPLTVYLIWERKSIIILLGFD